MPCSDKLLEDYDIEKSLWLPYHVSHSRTHYRPSSEINTPFEFDLSQDDALKVGVYSTGKGKRPPQPIVCLHGISSNHKIFAPVIRHLNYPFGVLAMDLRGRGDSMKPPANSADKKYMLKRHAEDVIRVLDYFRLTRAALVGHSFGG